MIVWLLGGIDPTGGAGVTRDAATLRAVAPDATGVVLVTAHTQQGHGAPASAVAVSADRLREIAARSPPPHAIKIGLVPAEVAAVVAEIVAMHAVPRVVDPVLAASDGGTMGARADALEEVLALATIVTPNRPEAAAFTGRTVDDAGLLEACMRVWPRAWVLLKDGHRDAPVVRDELARGQQRHAFERPRARGPDRRGTGCALATAIAAGLGRGDPVPLAVARAIAWLDRTRTTLVPVPG